MGTSYASLYDRLCAHCFLDGTCWTWIGPVRRHGGGDRPAVSMRTRGARHPVTDRALHPVQKNAARLMCELFHGPAPTPEHEASHLCDQNWLCVMPFHLIWETKKENMARMWKKRRTESACDINAGIKADPNQIPF